MILLIGNSRKGKAMVKFPKQMSGGKGLGRGLAVELLCTITVVVGLLL
jgi:hypothetical protein